MPGSAAFWQAIYIEISLSHRESCNNIVVRVIAALRQQPVPQRPKPYHLGRFAVLQRLVNIIVNDSEDLVMIALGFGVLEFDFSVSESSLLSFLLGLGLGRYHK